MNCSGILFTIHALTLFPFEMKIKRFSCYINMMTRSILHSVELNCQIIFHNSSFDPIHQTPFIPVPAVACRNWSPMRPGVHKHLTWSLRQGCYAPSPARCRSAYTISGFSDPWLSVWAEYWRSRTECEPMREYRQQAGDLRDAPQIIRSFLNP